MSNIILEESISSSVLMVGVFAGNNAHGGMVSVVQSYKPYFKPFHYIASWKDSSQIIKWGCVFFAAIKIFFILLINKKIKIVHFHTAGRNSFWRKSKLIFVARIFKNKIILHIHSGLFKEFYDNSSLIVQKNIVKKLNRVDSLIVLSHSWKQWFVGIGIAPDKITIINNIVDYPCISFCKKNDDKLHLLFLGEISDNKGVFDILKSLYENKEKISGKLIFKIGGNKNEKKLLNMIFEFDLKDIVQFEGWVSGEKKDALLNWADVYILPSYYEGLPISILEAMSYQCAIISSPVGGIPDIIINKKNGLLVTPGNSIEIYQAIQLLLENRSLLNIYQQSNNELIKDYYPDTVIRQLRHLYIQLLQ